MFSYLQINHLVCLGQWFVVDLAVVREETLLFKVQRIISLSEHVVNK